MRAPRKLTFTREGKWFVLMTIMVGFGAVNTNNNLLFLLLGMMLGLIIASGLLSEQTLREVSIRRLPHEDLFAGRPGRLTYEVTNGKRRLASYGIVVVEHEQRDSRARRRRALGLPEEPPKSAKAREAEADPGPPRALAMRVKPGETALATAACTFPRRGVYQFDGHDIATRFPFGFFEKSRPVYEATEVLVYPAIEERLSQLEEGAHVVGEVVRQAEGRGGDFFGLRAYREGDDPRMISWKASARRNQLVSRLFEREDADAVALHLYNYLPAADTTPEAEEAFERAVSATASLCARFVREGQRFSLHTIDGEVGEGSGPGQLQMCLRHLAMLEARRDADPPPFVLSRRGNRILVAPAATPETVMARFQRVVRGEELPSEVAA
jgi:uncharacterized protein (DUF58 family)